MRVNEKQVQSGELGGACYGRKKRRERTEALHGKIVQKMFVENVIMQEFNFRQIL